MFICVLFILSAKHVHFPAFVTLQQRRQPCHRNKHKMNIFSKLCIKANVCNSAPPFFRLIRPITIYLYVCVCVRVCTFLLALVSLILAKSHVTMRHSYSTADIDKGKNNNKYPHTRAEISMRK